MVYSRSSKWFGFFKLKVSGVSPQADQVSEIAIAEH